MPWYMPIIFFSIILQFIILVMPFNLNEEFYNKLFNPITIYKNHKVNYFGAFLITLFSNCFLFIHAICFWFYKLCTVGRKN